MGKTGRKRRARKKKGANHGKRPNARTGFLPDTHDDPAPSGPGVVLCQGRCRDAVSPR